MRSKLMSLFLAGVLAFSSCSKKQEKPKVMPRTPDRNVATAVQSVPEPRSELEDLLKRTTSTKPIAKTDRFSEEMKNYDSEIDRKIIDVRITEEEKRLTAYFNRYHAVLGDRNAQDTKSVLNTIDKLISELQRERFNYEPELIKRHSHKFQGVKKLVSALKDYRNEMKEIHRKRIAASLNRVNSHIVLPRGTYSFNFDIFINSSGRLEIQPGTELHFSSDVGVIAYGVLRAVGTKDERIVFTSSGKRWRNICILNGSSVLEYCTITNGSGRKTIPRGGSKDIEYLQPVGGGLFISGVSPQIRYCTISNNKSGYAGGGIFMTNSNATIKECTISNNTAEGGWTWGGGIYMGDSNPSIVRCTISYNKASRNGGGLCIEQSKPTLQANTIRNNKAGNVGGGIHIDKSSNPTLQSNVIRSNQGGNGGGIGIFNSRATLENNEIIGNSAGKGGGIYYMSFPDSRGDKIENNTPDDSCYMFR